MYNPTCVISGRKDNLKMHALRNEKGDMTGWVFVNAEIEKDLINVKVETYYQIVGENVATIRKEEDALLDSRTEL